MVSKYPVGYYILLDSFILINNTQWPRRGLVRYNPTSEALSSVFPTPPVARCPLFPLVIIRIAPREERKTTNLIPLRILPNYNNGANI